MLRRFWWLPLIWLVLIGVLVTIASVEKPPANNETVDLQQPTLVKPAVAQPTTKTPNIANTPTRTPFLPVTRQPNAPVSSPTADPPKLLPTQRSKEVKHTVKTNETLGSIARLYGVDIELIIQANKITNPNLLNLGQILVIPVPSPQSPGPDFKIIPDSELVYGPASANLDISAFINQQDGYLEKYEEVIDRENFTGSEIVKRVSQETSTNPRLLLAVLEYQSGWVTLSNPAENRRDYPIGFLDATKKGLYRQLFWAANNLNRGYYLWRVNAINNWVLTDGKTIPVSPVINAGTAGAQHLMSLLYDQSGWNKAVSSKGLFTTYTKFFGYPFDLAVDPVLPTKLSQPKLQLPFITGEIWSFTGGPHSGWGDGTGWAALDFAPPGEPTGCAPSAAWVVAMADGVIVRSERGLVIQDLDNDGKEQTGWSILYAHIATKDRVNTGKMVRAGEHIGHPSCEGGLSDGTHVHIARRYNGEWIAADGSLPFNLDGWISEGAGVEYDGFLKRKGEVVEAWNARRSENQIQR